MKENDMFILASKICEELARDCITKEDALSVAKMVIQILSAR